MFVLAFIAAVLFILAGVGEICDRLEARDKDRRTMQEHDAMRTALLMANRRVSR